MEKNKTKTIGAILYIISAVLILATVIALCVYCNFASGIKFSQIELYVNGEYYNADVEVKNGVNEIDVKTDKGIDYYLCIDSNYGCILDNSKLIIENDIEKSTFIPIKVVLIKRNYATREYVFYLMVA